MLLDQAQSLRHLIFLKSFLNFGGVEFLLLDSVREMKTEVQFIRVVARVSC